MFRGFLTNSRSRVLLDKLTVADLVNKLLAVYETGRLITAFTRASHCSLPSTSSIRSTLSNQKPRVAPSHYVVSSSLLPVLLPYIQTLSDRLVHLYNNILMQTSLSRKPLTLHMTVPVCASCIQIGITTIDRYRNIDFCLWGRCSRWWNLSAGQWCRVTRSGVR
jgi:hypothetical protein